MAVLALGLALLLAMAAHSDAAYCVCSTGGDAVFQKNIDYACANGADCSAIQQNGACFNPNTIRDHCNYAVNSYYQKKGQSTGSCDFTGSCNVTQTPPSTNTNSGCVYQSSPSTGGTTTPGTPATGGGTPPTGGGTPPTGGGSTTPPTGGGTTPPTGGGTTPSTGGGMTPPTGTTNPGMTPGTPGTFISPPGSTSINPLGPSGNGFGLDSSAGVSLSIGNVFMLMSYYSVTLLLSGLVCLRI